MCKKMDDICVTRIVSGGQTGVDRGALDAAIDLKIAHGGWCPRGRLAEDGVIPERYELTDTSSPKYSFRTEQNVIDSDATLILHVGDISGGTHLTRRMAAKHDKPCLVVDMTDGDAIVATRRWIAENAISVLNIAGPRESSAKGISTIASDFVRTLFATE